MSDIDEWLLLYDQGDNLAQVCKNGSEVSRDTRFIHGPAIISVASCRPTQVRKSYLLFSEDHEFDVSTATTGEEPAMRLKACCGAILPHCEPCRGCEDIPVEHSACRATEGEWPEGPCILYDEQGRVLFQSPGVDAERCQKMVIRPCEMNTVENLV